MNYSTQTDLATSRDGVWSMFDRIAPRYDCINRLLSFRKDVVWRRRVARLLPREREIEVLDLATGTADQLFALVDRGLIIRRGVGIDLSERMLEVGRRKIEARGLGDRLELRSGDAMALPFPDQSFDAVTMSFGIRNVVDVLETLKEIRRVLRPGGRALILEFSIPPSVSIRRFYFCYLRWTLPLLGRVISGDPYAYRYLNLTIEDFPHGAAFSELMLNAGFARASVHQQTLGIAAIYEGNCPTR
ncbi:MAG TPA: bifunctional demethylmenaquinone methyltransferase/2-methoxy-6-polyprenyl-1,4-benzoquinol methylase UbiE [Kiritimatiellia bacterium]|nr:bifunctional demethylmenaquinone methyltransferase/2-methoxy-6-polyprenyl-1,4-benzoquinol methylase UbiE [Kiritimatiellia bacterium]